MHGPEFVIMEATLVGMGWIHLWRAKPNRRPIITTVVKQVEILRCAA
jgi:hypothetical protein